MTYREDFTLPASIVEAISSQGLDGLPELIRLPINTAMQAERQQYFSTEGKNQSSATLGFSPEWVWGPGFIRSKLIGNETVIFGDAPPDRTWLVTCPVVADVFRGLRNNFVHRMNEVIS